MTLSKHLIKHIYLTYEIPNTSQLPKSLSPPVLKPDSIFPQDLTPHIPRPDTNIKRQPYQRKPHAIMLLISITNTHQLRNPRMHRYILNRALYDESTGRPYK